jgi:glucose/arabinose dehydrogenase
MRRVLAALGVVVLLAACGDDDDAAVDTGSASTVPATTSSATGATTTQLTAQPPGTQPPGTQPPGTQSAGTQPAGTPGATLPPATEPVFGDPVVASERVAELDQPIGLGVRPGDDALYVVEQAGHVVRVTLPGGEAQMAVVADVSDRTSADGERGLLGLAFAPDGSMAYLDYTDLGGNTVVAEYPVAADGTFDVAAERVLINIGQPYPNHNGGDLAIGPDGMLYIAMGDGGSGGDPQRRASDPTNLLGKLLRIDPNPSGDSQYTIPPDNPFATGAMGDVAGAPEVWAWGLRNPWKFTFDPVTSDLWIADVGQNVVEEVDHVTPSAEHPAGWGANFGWSAFEGNDRYNDDVDDPGNLVFPVWTYQHGDDGCSISGGAVYRGAAIAGLSPAFVYGDLCSGRVWAFDAASGRNVQLLDGFSQLAAIRTGPDGELYVLEQAGGLDRLVPG